MMTDPIADMLTRIRNAVRVERPDVEVPYSNLKKNVAEVMKREGYIWDYEIVEAEPVNQIRIVLKYGPNGERVIRPVMSHGDRDALCARRDRVLDQIQDVKG